MGLQPGWWLEETAKTQPKQGEVKKIDTDPPLWAHLRRLGKKPLKVSQEEWRESAKRGGAKAKEAKQKKKLEKMLFPKKDR